MRTSLPITSFALPKNFFTADCVITIDRNCVKAVVASPSANGNVSILNSELSAYLPDVYIDFSPTRNNNLISSSDTRQVLTIPGISFFIVLNIGLGVDQFVK